MIGWIVASLSASGWRFMWIRPRRAMTHVSWTTPRGGCGRRRRRRGRRRRWWRSSVPPRSPSLGRRRGRSAGQGQEHLVERGLAQAEVVDGDVAPPSERLAASSSVSTPWLIGAITVAGLGVDPGLDAGDRRRRGGRPRRGEPGSTTTTWRWSPPTSRLSLRASPRAMIRPWSMTMMSSARRSASSRYWVVSSSVVPRSTRCVEHRPQLGAGPGVEAGGGLVEEQHLGVGHQGGGQVEPAPHAARSSRRSPGRRRRPARTPPAARAARSVGLPCGGAGGARRA